LPGISIEMIYLMQLVVSTHLSSSNGPGSRDGNFNLLWPGR
jgi:hypothetical protein